jgi:hypothetical protein
VLDFNVTTLRYRRPFELQGTDNHRAAANACWGITAFASKHSRVRNESQTDEVNQSRTGGLPKLNSNPLPKDEASTSRFSQKVSEVPLIANRNQRHLLCGAPTWVGR